MMNLEIRSQENPKMSILTLAIILEHKHILKRPFEVCPNGNWEECYRQCMKTSCIGVDPVTCSIASTGCSLGTFLGLPISEEPSIHPSPMSDSRGGRRNY